MFETIILNQPNPPPTQLVLLLHGVGAQPQDLIPVGRALGARWPTACIVSVQSPDPSDLGQGSTVNGQGLDDGRGMLGQRRDRDLHEREQRQFAQGVV